MLRLPRSLAISQDDAYEYLVEKQAGGIDTEAADPYKGRADTCAFDTSTVGAKISGFVDVPPGDEDALLDAVATVGPIAVAVDASIGWQLYFGGVLKPTLCSSKQGKMDHGVTVVGYGTEGTTDYWWIKNSWGGSWGEKGYVRLERGKNACGVANAASYPKDVSVA
jgi:cathepsin L